MKVFTDNNGKAYVDTNGNALKIDNTVRLQDKTITENGTYTADSGYDGFREVDVNVFDNFDWVINGENLFRQKPGETYDITFPEEFTVHFRNNKTLAGMFWGDVVVHSTPKKVKIIADQKVTSLHSLCNQNKTIEELDLTDVDTSMVTTYGYMLAGSNIKKVYGDLDMSCTRDGNSTVVQQMFIYTYNLEEIRFVPNTIYKLDGSYFDFSSDNPLKLSTASLVSLANGFNETVTEKTIRCNQGQKNAINAIVGIYSLDETQTFHIFTADENGDTTLTEFITEIKGWTIA